MTLMHMEENEVGLPKVECA